MEIKTYYDGCGNRKACYEAFVASASKVAAWLVERGGGKLPGGTEERKIFGKRFEETYEQFCYDNREIMDAIWYLTDRDKESISFDVNPHPFNACPSCGKSIPPSTEKNERERLMELDEISWCTKCQRAWCVDCEGMPSHFHDYGVYCDDCVGIVALESFKSSWNGKFGENGIEDAMMIAKAFIKDAIHGRTPPTRYRRFRDDLCIAAKPDLITSDYYFKGGNMDDRDNWGSDDHYLEFKVYGGGDFATMQCKVFSWVLDQPITLVTWNGEQAIKEVIDGRDLDLSGLPDSLFKEVDEEGKSGGYHRYTTDEGRNVFDAWRLVKPRVPLKITGDGEDEP